MKPLKMVPLEMKPLEMVPLEMMPLKIGSPKKSESRTELSEHGIRIFFCEMYFYYLAFLQGFLYIDDALVAAATEEEVGIALVLHERTVYQHVYQLQEFQLSRILYQVFKEVTREAPDGLVALLADGTRQLGKAFCLKHGVTPREGNVGEGIVHNLLHQFLGRCHRAMIDIP